MSTWAELGDDFRQTVLLYTEKLPITEPQIMRWLSRGQSDFQRKTRYVEGTKNLVTADSYDLGDDILEIRAVIDSDGTELLLLGYDQYKEAIDRAGGGTYGYHETPQHWSWRKNLSTLSDWGNLGRICTVWENKLLRYPTNTDATIEVRYIKNVHPFSSASTQWSAWYPLDTDFPTKFKEEQPLVELREWEDAFVAYAVGQYLESISNGNAPLFTGRYEQMVAEAIRLKPVLYQESVAPYNISPFSS
jgi:hypothetical protein